MESAGASGAYSSGRDPRRQGKRAGHVALITLAILFIGASAGQIIRAVFGLSVRPLPATQATSGMSSPAGVCSRGIRSLVLALDRPGGPSGRTPASGGGAPGSPGTDRKDKALRNSDEGDVRADEAQWDGRGEVAQACASSPEGLDAWAALLRLRRAKEQFPRDDGEDVAPLRRDVTAHLPVDLR